MDVSHRQAGAGRWPHPDGCCLQADLEKGDASGDLERGESLRRGFGLGDSKGHQGGGTQGKGGRKVIRGVGSGGVPQEERGAGWLQRIERGGTPGKGVRREVRGGRGRGILGLRSAGEPGTPERAKGPQRRGGGPSGGAGESSGSMGRPGKRESPRA